MVIQDASCPRNSSLRSSIFNEPEQRFLVGEGWPAARSRTTAKENALSASLVAQTLPTIVTAVLAEPIAWMHSSRNSLLESLLSIPVVQLHGSAARSLHVSRLRDLQLDGPGRKPGRGTTRVIYMSVFTTRCDR